MGWRTIYIEESNNISLYLDNIKILVENGQILVPLKDIDTLLIDNYKATISCQLISKCSQNNINLIICDINHIPFSQTLPIYGNCLSSKLLKNQLNWSEEIKGLLRQKIVKHKIINQKYILGVNQRNKKAIKLIEDLLETVEIYDKTNREGLVAKIYFRTLFGKEFIRFREDSINAALNYGYTILRSMISRSIVAKGLNPMLGVFHKGESNNFNLSDDIIEVFRPLIDHFVFNHIKEDTIFNREIRLDILKFLSFKILINEKKQTISNAIDIFIDSIINFCENSKPIIFPTMKIYDV